MSRFVNTTHYPHDSKPRIGVLLTNLGTPDAPTSRALRRYLREFLSDPRVVEIPRFLWLLILNGLILITRPARSARLYQKVWTEDGSPLLVIARKQASAIQQALQNKYADAFQVELAMRYGSPSIAEGLERLRQARITHLIVMPLYPQYSATTTASTFDAISRVLQKWRWLPHLHMIMDYHQDEKWIAAVAQSISEYRQSRNAGEKLLMSFHGLPRKFLLSGDPYYCQCQASARLIADRLGLADDQWQIVFQSRFGRAEWLQPYCSETLEALGRSYTKSVDIVCPGFSADCLETLEEIAGENREVFLKAGGKHYAYIPALNDRTAHIEALTDIIVRHCQDWLQHINVPPDVLAASKKRAMAHGAPR